MKNIRKIKGTELNLSDHKYTLDLTERPSRKKAPWKAVIISSIIIAAVILLLNQ